MVTRKCNNYNCQITYEAREADLNRGWGKSCSKRCAAIVRRYGSRKMAAASKKYRFRPNDNRTYEHSYISCDDDQSWDAHKRY